MIGSASNLPTITPWIAPIAVDIATASTRSSCAFSRQASNESAGAVLGLGPRYVILKKGEHGAFLLSSSAHFSLPAYPVEEVVDPTGAGDSFAGGFMGYIASQGEINREVLKRALFYGGVMGSFAVERFGTERLQNLKREEIDERFQIFRELTHLE